MLNLLGVRDWRALGLAVGGTSDGTGTAGAFDVSHVAGALSSFATRLNALAAAVLLPVLVSLP